MPQNPAGQVHALLGRCDLSKTFYLKTRTAAILIWFYTLQSFWQCWLCRNQNSGQTKRQSQTYQNTCWKMTLQTKAFARKKEPDKKTELNLPKRWLKTMKPILETRLCRKIMLARKTDIARWKLLPARTLTRVTKPVLETWQNRRWNYARKRQEPIFEKCQTWKTATAKRPDLNEPKLLLKTRNLIMKTR